MVTPVSRIRYAGSKNSMVLIFWVIAFIVSSCGFRPPGVARWRKIPSDMDHAKLSHLAKSPFRVDEKTEAVKVPIGPGREHDYYVEFQIEYLRQFLSMYPDSWEGRLYLGIAYAQLWEVDLAEQEFAKAHDILEEHKFERSPTEYFRLSQDISTLRQRWKLALSSAPVEGFEAFLQINTVPSEATITVNDRFVGHSPVRVSVDSRIDQTIQITKEGCREIVRLIDDKDLEPGETRNILEELKFE